MPPCSASRSWSPTSPPPRSRAPPPAAPRRRPSGRTPTRPRAPCTRTAPRPLPRTASCARPAPAAATSRPRPRSPRACSAPRSCPRARRPRLPRAAHAHAPAAPRQPRTPASFPIPSLASPDGSPGCSRVRELAGARALRRAAAGATSMCEGAVRACGSRARARCRLSFPLRPLRRTGAGLLRVPRRRSPVLRPRRHGRGGGQLLALPRDPRLQQAERRLAARGRRSRARDRRGEPRPAARPLRELDAARPPHLHARRPVVWNQIEHFHHEERTHSTLSGLGDVSLATSVVLWRDRPVLPSRWLEGRVWLKAPTGRDEGEETKVDGERDPHLQPGTGSWDFGVGLAGVQRMEWGSLYGSVFRRWNNAARSTMSTATSGSPRSASRRRSGICWAGPALDFLDARARPRLPLCRLRRAGRRALRRQRRRHPLCGAVAAGEAALGPRGAAGLAALRGAAPARADLAPQRQYEKAVWSVGVLVPF